MKKKLLVFVMSISTSFWATCVYSQQDNLTNLSVESMRTGGRNAALDAADIAVYNPAGVVKLENGIHINIGNQMFFRNPTHEFTIPGQTEKKYHQSKPNLFLPNLFVAYKKDKIGIFGGVYVCGGGGSLNYPDGSINTDLMSLQLLSQPPPFGFHGVYSNTKASIKGNSYYTSPMVGVAYAFTKKLSAAASFKYIIASNNEEAQVTLTESPLMLPDNTMKLQAKDKANGFGWAIGVNYSYSDKGNIAFHYEGKSKLDFKTNVEQDDFKMLQDGQKKRRDLPAYLAIGTGYKLTEKFSALIDFNYFFQKQADWDTNMAGKEWSKIAGDVYKIAGGVGYQMTKKLKATFGVSYTVFNYEDISAYYQNLGMFEVIRDNNLNFGIGASFNLSKMFSVQFAFDQTFWEKDKVITEYSPITQEPYNVTTNNHVTTIAIGANLKI